MRLSSSLCLSTVLATTMFQGGVVGRSSRRGLVAAFAASSHSSTGTTPGAPARHWSAIMSSALGGGGASDADTSLSCSSSSAHARAFVTSERLRAGGLSFGGGGRGSGSGGPLGLGPLRASSSTQEEAATDSTTEEDAGISPKELRSQILSAAHAAAHITGPSTSLSTFGGQRFVDTSLLDSAAPRQHRVLFVLGGPGAGKGTQSERIVESYKCVHLSVGELLRKEHAKKGARQGPHAAVIEDALVNGSIVPVAISLELLRNAMDAAVSVSAADGHKYGSRIFLVDGFPRNFDNLEGWTADMPESASAVGVLCYDCPCDVLEERILGRAEAEKSKGGSERSDDNVESARKRFRTFQEQTVPCVEALEEVARMQAEAEAAEKQGGSGAPEKGSNNGGKGMGMGSSSKKGKKGGSKKKGGANKTGGMAKMRVERITAIGTIDEVWDRTRAAMNSFVRDDVLSASKRLMAAVDAGNVEAYASLCDPKLLVDDDDDAPDDETDLQRLERIFREYEAARVDTGPNGPTDAIRTPTLTQSNVITHAAVDVQDGTHAVVSYVRTMKLEIEGQVVESAVRETRVWEHGERGWGCVHFYRKPVE